MSDENIKIPLTTDVNKLEGLRYGTILMQAMLRSTGDGSYFDQSMEEFTKFNKETEEDNK